MWFCVFCHDWCDLFMSLWVSVISLWSKSKPSSKITWVQDSCRLIGTDYKYVYPSAVEDLTDVIFVGNDAVTPNDCNFNSNRSILWKSGFIWFWNWPIDLWLRDVIGLGVGRRFSVLFMIMFLLYVGRGRISG